VLVQGEQGGGGEGAEGARAQVGRDEVMEGDRGEVKEGAGTVTVHARGGRVVDGKGEKEMLADKGALSNFFTRLETELEAREYVKTEEKRRAIFPKIRNGLCASVSLSSICQCACVCEVIADTCVCVVMADIRCFPMCISAYTTTLPIPPRYPSPQINTTYTVFLRAQMTTKDVSTMQVDACVCVYVCLCACAHDLTS